MSDEKDIKTQEEEITEETDVVSNTQSEDTPTPEDEIEKLQKSLDEEKDKYLRLLAEYDNYRRRTAKEKTEAYGDASAKVIKEILPALDNFERAAEAESSDQQYKDGTIMIFNQLKDIIGKIGVVEIDALGSEFDPNFHQAIKQEHSDEYPENTVCQVFQKGYMLGDRLIRPAMVVVSQD